MIRNIESQIRQDNGSSYKLFWCQKGIHKGNQLSILRIQYFEDEDIEDHEVCLEKSLIDSFKTLERFLKVSSFAMPIISSPFLDLNSHRACEIMSKCLLRYFC